MKIINLLCFYIIISNSSSIKILHFSHYSEQCGIAEYTQSVNNELNNRQGIYSEIYPCSLMRHHIFIPKIKNLDDAELSFIEKFDVFCVNTHGYCPSILIKLLEELKLKNKFIVAICHEVGQDFDDLLNVADIAIIHREMQGNFILSDHKLKKIQIFSLPTLDFKPNSLENILRRKYGFTDNDFILSTTGFLVEWKKIDEFLTNLIPLIKKYKNLKIQLLNARHLGTPQSLIDKINHIINSNQINNQVFFDTSFKELNEIHERLFCSNLGFLYGNISKGSEYIGVYGGSSASLKTLITSKLPSVLLNMHHYDDSNQGMVLCNSVDEMICQIDLLINDNSLLSALREKINIDCEQKSIVKYVDKLIKLINNKQNVFLK
jgi:hypothetical protein